MALLPAVSIGCAGTHCPPPQIVRQELPDEPCEFHKRHPGVNRAKVLEKYLEWAMYDDCRYDFDRGKWMCR